MSPLAPASRVGRPSDLAQTSPLHVHPSADVEARLLCCNRCVELDDGKLAETAGNTPRGRRWRRVADRATFGIANASSCRSLLIGGLALFAVGVLLWALGLTGQWSVPDQLGVDGWPRWLHLPTLAAAVLAVLLFRYRPAAGLSLGAAAVTADVALGGSLGVLLALWELLFCVGLLGSARTRQVVNTAAAAVVVAGSTAVFVANADLSRAVVIGLQLIAMFGLPLWWAANVRQKSDLADLAAQRADLEAERARLQTRRVADLERIGELRRTEALHAERSAIARDLHDAIASRLSTIAIHSAAALSVPGRPQDDAMRTVRAQALEALQEMRTMIVVLRSESGLSTSRPVSVVDGLEPIAELVDAARGAGLRVRLELPDGGTDRDAKAPVAVAQAAYRIVQEALANAAKHAPESDVSVSVCREGSAVRVVVENSFTASAAADHPALSTGTGLNTMRERTEALGGRFAAAPDAAAAVWHVEASLPLSPSGEKAGVA